jgi:hypothetical protein
VRPDPRDPADRRGPDDHDDHDDVDAPVRPEPIGYDPSTPTRVAITDVDTGGIDTDADGRADSSVAVDGPDLVLHTDFDGDGLADQVLRLGPATLSAALSAPRAAPATVEHPTEVHWWAPWTWFTDP